MSSGWLAQPNNIADAAKTNIFITVRSIILSKTIKVSKWHSIKRLQGQKLRACIFDVLHHRLVSSLVHEGVPLYDITQLMGHKSLEMVKRYAHLPPDYQENTFSALYKLGH